MAINLLERRDFTAAVDKTALKAPKMFVETLFFGGGVETHLSRIIDWEALDGSDRMAVYINPTEQSRLVEGSGTEIKSISLPVTGEHKMFSSEDLALTKGYAGALYGATAGEIQSYRNSKIAAGIADLINRVRRLREWAACQAVTTGKIKYVGDSISFVLDFQFPASRVIKLTGANKWDSSSDVDIIAQGRARRRETTAAGGAGASICVMGWEAAEKFMTNTKTLAYLHNNNFRVGALDLTKEPIEGATFLGQIGGISYYEYSQQYTDRDGNVQEMWPKNVAVYYAPSRNLRRHRGPIVWEEEGVQTGEFASRQIVRKDPDGRKIQLASCELPIIHDSGSLVIVTTH